MEAARVDRWLWAVRLYRSRAASTEACRAGHVRINDLRAKPASRVRAGDRVRALAGGRERLLEVVEPIDIRRSAGEAVGAFLDHSPALLAKEPPPAIRPPSTGRPTKRERRQIDHWRGR